MRTLPAFLLLTVLACLQPAARAEDAPPATKGPIPLELTVRTKAARSGYGTPLRLTVRFHNPSKTRTAHVWWDRRSDGVLTIELEDEDGLVWQPLEQNRALPVIQLQPSARLVGQTWFPGLATTPLAIAPGRFVDLPFAFDQAVLKDPPAADRAGRWLRPLPPGRYRVRATYEKKDALVPAGHSHWHPRLIQVQPTVVLRPVPNLWLGRLTAGARIEAVAPRTADVDALRQRIRTLEARNAALRKQVEAIREILRGG